MYYICMFVVAILKFYWQTFIIRIYVVVFIYCSLYLSVTIFFPTTSNFMSVLCIL